MLMSLAQMHNQIKDGEKMMKLEKILQFVSIKIRQMRRKRTNWTKIS